MDIRLLSANHLQLIQLHSMLSITVWIPLCSALGAFFADTCDDCLTTDGARPLIPTPRDIGNVTSRGHVEPCHCLLLVINAHRQRYSHFQRLALVMQYSQ